MAREWNLQRLRAEHCSERIRARLDGGRAHSYVGDAILGAVDGCVTTFAVVAGSVGAGFPGAVVLVLGFANLVADGFSMAAGNYLGTKSEREQIDRAREEEHRHIDEVPDGEREEVRQIFARKGFHGETLDHIVSVITRDRELWVDTMITEELGLRLESPSAIRAGLSTLAAFIVAGVVPLVPFLFGGEQPDERFVGSAIVTALVFWSVGTLKGWALDRPPLRSGLETLAIGSGAAVLAYFFGCVLGRAFGA